jgi:hypothetical protein
VYIPIVSATRRAHLTSGLVKGAGPKQLLESRLMAMYSRLEIIAEASHCSPVESKFVQKIVLSIVTAWLYEQGLLGVSSVLTQDVVPGRK